MTIEDLIAEGEEIKQSIVGHKVTKKDEFEIWRQKTFRYLNQTVPGDMVIEQYEIIVNNFNPTYCSQQSFERVLSVLKAFKELPSITKRTRTTNTGKQGGNISITNTLSQNQEQNQSLISTIFEESIKDELTGGQIKALRSILKDDTIDSEQKKEQLMDKFKEFGPEVMSKVLSNIVEHPEVLPRI